MCCWTTGDAVSVGRSDAPGVGDQQAEPEATRAAGLDLAGFRLFSGAPERSLATDEGRRWRADLPLALAPASLMCGVKESEALSFGSPFSTLIAHVLPAISKAHEMTPLTWDLFYIKSFMK